jgi:hypothetical protein
MQGLFLSFLSLLSFCTNFIFSDALPSRKRKRPVSSAPETDDSSDSSDEEGPDTMTVAEGADSSYFPLLLFYTLVLLTILFSFRYASHPTGPTCVEAT